MTYATSSRDILGVVGLLGCEEPVSYLIFAGEASELC